MRSFLQNLLIIMIAVVLTAGMAIPYICLDDDSIVSKVEQQVKAEKIVMNDYQDSSNGDDHCCVAHHCCFAKLISPAQSIRKVNFASKIDLPIIEQNHLSSFDPKGLDRPPKFFA